MEISQNFLAFSEYMNFTYGYLFIIYFCMTTQLQNIDSKILIQSYFMILSRNHEEAQKKTKRSKYLFGFLKVIADYKGWPRLPKMWENCLISLENGCIFCTPLTKMERNLFLLIFLLWRSKHSSISHLNSQERFPSLVRLIFQKSSNILRRQK